LSSCLFSFCCDRFPAFNSAYRLHIHVPVVCGRFLLYVETVRFIVDPNRLGTAATVGWLARVPG
jgi:hypothetical protein